MTIRELKEEEYPMLETFLYGAIFQREGEEKLPFEVIYRPELYVYVNGFGTRKGDLALCAEENGTVTGIVWCRIIPAYGHVDDETPEFAISVSEEHRGKGTGTALMRRMLEVLKENGYERASLSVQKDNYACEMYRKVGFEPVTENEEEYIMIARL